MQDLAPVHHEEVRTLASSMDEDDSSCDSQTDEYLRNTHSSSQSGSLASSSSEQAPCDFSGLSFPGDELEAMIGAWIDYDPPSVWY
jgi:hypothetical protein